MTITYGSPTYSNNQPSDDKANGCTNKKPTEIRSRIPFYDAGGFEMFYSTPWVLTHPDRVRGALTSAGFKLGTPSGMRCGYLYERDVGSMFSYTGTLWGRQGHMDGDPRWNASSISLAERVIVVQRPVLEKALTGVSPIIALVLFAAFWLVCVCGMCGCMSVRKRFRRGRGGDDEANHVVVNVVPAPGTFDGSRTTTVDEEKTWAIPPPPPSTTLSYDPMQQGQGTYNDVIRKG